MFQCGVKQLSKDAEGKWVSKYNWSQRYATLNELLAAIAQHPEAILSKDIRIVQVR